MLKKKTRKNYQNLSQKEKEYKGTIWSKTKRYKNHPGRKKRKNPPQ